MENVKEKVFGDEEGTMSTRRMRTRRRLRKVRRRSKTLRRGVQKVKWLKIRRPLKLQGGVPCSD